ncbi:phosphatase PAP2 family protein [Spirillospora sp. CA-294931]|uniref:phosphatase PAP2 family protein n=1 Tax=Spirillospora sp. CA-294931 TaxID=3240042 RepID=UPI003D90E638
MTNSRNTVLAGGLGLGAVLVAGALLGDRVPPLDAWVADHLYAESGFWADAAVAVSGAGTILAVVAVLAAAVALWWRERSAVLVARCAAVLAACLGTLVLQTVFQRSGPPVTEQDWTYPSGHVVVMTALGFTAVMIARRLPPLWRGVVVPGAAVMIALVGASRVVLGEHYLVDVVAALVATAGVGLLASAVFRTRPDDSVRTT